MTDNITREIHGALEKRYVDSSEISTELLDSSEPVINLTMHEFGDMQIQVAASGSQVFVSTILCEASQVKDRAEFNDACMRINPINPLSNLGLTEIDGKDIYIVFGELSSASSIDDLDEEIRTLAANTVDAAETLKSHFLGA